MLHQKIKRNFKRYNDSKKTQNIPTVPLKYDKQK